MSEEHLQLLIQINYFFTRRASNMELLHLAVINIFRCIPIDQIYLVLDAEVKVRVIVVFT